MDRSSTVCAKAMSEESMESVSANALTDLSRVEVGCSREMGLAAMLTVVILNTGAKILVEILSLCALISCVGVFKIWLFIGVEF